MAATGSGSGTYTATIIHPDGCEVQEDIIVPEGAIVNNYNITNDTKYKYITL